MLSSKLTLWVIIGVVLLIGLAMFPAFHTIFNNSSTTGMTTQFLGIKAFMPYIFLGIIGYAVYIISKKGK
jgi:uncharacterized membrane protein